MEPLERIFRNFGRGEEQEVELGIYNYRVRELDGGVPGFIGIGTQIKTPWKPDMPPEIKGSPPEFEMAVVCFWPHIPTDAGYDGPQLQFNMRRYPSPGAEDVVYVSMRHITLKNPPDKFSRAIISTILPYAQALCTML